MLRPRGQGGGHGPRHPPHTRRPPQGCSLPWWPRCPGSLAEVTTPAPSASAQATRPRPSGPPALTLPGAGSLERRKPPSATAARSTLGRVTSPLACPGRAVGWAHWTEQETEGCGGGGWGWSWGSHLQTLPLPCCLQLSPPCPRSSRDKRTTELQALVLTTASRWGQYFLEAPRVSFHLRHQCRCHEPGNVSEWG